jgi:very-short-patch-repair endonuclease
MDEDHLIEIPNSKLTVSTKRGYLHLQTDELWDGTRVLTIGIKVKDIQISVNGIKINVEVKKRASRKLPPGEIFGEEIENTFSAHPFSKVNKCESPLEARFFIFSLDRFPEIEPQFIVDQYRLDFAIPREKVAIEIDGHEFHKTKEQRTKDTKRERYLQSKGWQVIRFTGTEIFENVYGCVEEVKNLVTVFGKKYDDWDYSEITENKSE